MHNLVTKKRNLNPSDLLLWIELMEMLYVPGVGKRHSFSCGSIDSSNDWTRGEPIRISEGRQASAP
jgi:hypothetical protein